MIELFEILLKKNFIHQYYLISEYCIESVVPTISRGIVKVANAK